MTDQKEPLMTYSPFTGQALDVAMPPRITRTTFKTTWTYNPWTGKQRHYVDVIADPLGLHIPLPEEPRERAPFPQFNPPHDGWISWGGGERPVSPETSVRIRMRDGNETSTPYSAWKYRWSHDGTHSDIVAYRVVQVAENQTTVSSAGVGRGFGPTVGGITGASTLAAPNQGFTISSSIPAKILTPTVSTIALPIDAKARKAIPVYSGFIKYFPRAIAAIAELSRKGNDQHNPGKPLHWDRSKSGDELDAQCRHILDMASGVEVDTDDVLHATKNAWRALANLEKILEKA